MSFRKKKRRRAFFLFILLAALGGVLSGLCFLRQLQVERFALRDRAEGKAALEAGKYLEALLCFERYLNRHPDDAEVLYWFSQVRRRLPLPGRKHIDAAIQALCLSLELKPGGADAERALLELLKGKGSSIELLRLADDLLQGEPADTEALKAKAIALARLSRLDDALATALRVDDVAPYDIEGHSILFSILAKLGRTGELLTRAEALQKAHAGDPRFEVLLGLANFLAKDREKARTWMRLAALKTPPDATFAKELVDQLNTIGLFDESLSLLEKMTESHGDRELRQALIRRLWELGRFSEIATRWPSWSLSDNVAESESLAFLAMSLIRLERKREALPIVEALASRKGDSIALAWAAALDTVFIQEESSSTSKMKACQTALSACPENPYFRHFLGEAYALLGEGEKAVEAWALAAREAPTWTLPCLEEASFLARAGYASESLKAAKEARSRNPGDPAVAIAWALSLASGLPAHGAEQVDRLLDWVTQAQEAWPFEEETLLLQIDLLSRTDSKGEAVHRLEEALKAENLPSPRALIRLADLSRRARLGLEEACLERCEATYGLSPELAYAKAVIALQNRGKEDGLRLLGEGKGREFTPFSAPLRGALDPAWRVVRALYLDCCQDPRASNAWTSLADDASENIRIQRLALKSRAAWQDRAFMDRVIERLRKLTGEEALGWRLARARWILEAPTRDRETAQAALLINEARKAFPASVEARRLLAVCLRRLKSGQVEKPMEVSPAETLAREEPDPSSAAGAMTTVDCGSLDGAFDGIYFPVSCKAAMSSRKAFLAMDSVPEHLGDVVAGDFDAPSLFFHRPAPSSLAAEGGGLNDTRAPERVVMVTLPPPLWIGAALLVFFGILIGWKRKHRVGAES